MKRSAALFVVLGTLELLRRKKSSILGREALMAFSHRKVSDEEESPGYKATTIASLKKDIAEYQLREERKDAELLDLKNSLKEAVSQQSFLSRGLAEGAELVVKLAAGIEQRETEIRAKSVEVASLVEVLKREDARNEEREGRLLVSAAKEIKEELEVQLSLMRQTLAANDDFIVGLPTTMHSLEQNIAQEEQGIASLIQIDEEFETSTTRVQEKTDEIFALKRRIQELESRMVEKDALIFDLSSNIQELKSGHGVPCGLQVGVIEEEGKHCQSKANGIEHEHATQFQELQSSLDVMRSMLSEKDASQGELERKVAQLQSECTEKDRKIRSLLKANRKQEETLAEMEGRVLALTSTYEGLAEMRTKEKDRFESEIRSLRQTVTETSSLIAKVEGKVADLENEAAMKDEKVRSLLQAERDLKARIARRDRSIAEFKANLAAATTPTSPSRAQKPLQPKRDALPDLQTTARYEEKIAELTDKLAECHSLLKSCLNSPGRSPGRTPLSLWPPPYEPATTSNNVDVRTVATASPIGLDGPGFPAGQERFSAPR